MKAGLPVVRSFEILLERQKSPTLRRVLGDVRERVNSGMSISEAFAEEGDLFPRLFWTSLKAGEKSGEIESVLRRYVKYQKTVIGLSRKVVSTLVYPAILILLSIGLITILMTYVIPRFTEFFADFNADLPLLTVIVLGAATFLKNNILIIVGILGVGGFLVSRWVEDHGGPRVVRRRDPEAPDRGRHLPPLRDHAVHAQPRNAARRRHAARAGARELGRRDRQPRGVAQGPRGRAEGARGPRALEDPRRDAASSPT